MSEISKMKIFRDTKFNITFTFSQTKFSVE